MFQGNQVKDQDWTMAMFAELSSAPASMAAAKACDAYGLLPGFSCEASDAEQAYIQAKLNSDVPT